jgi:alpha-amylase/alpha-mannosidase (GH57 family)
MADQPSTPADQLSTPADQPANAGHYICIHGHFYQPPRENPWLEAVETEDSATPYHDWNDRITAECYAPNGASRILDGQGQIIRIVNNYSRMSFNFGPTLLRWLEENAPRTYRMVCTGDQKSAVRYTGHGSAIAQTYNHMIMPLANTRDRITQIRWGAADFEHRFGRKPEGMWLPETAVDRETLDLLAQNGIQFVILAPHQCLRVRELDEASAQPMLPELDGAGGTWTETPNASVDTLRPYLVNLNEGRSINVFFYNGPASRAIAFEGLLNRGESLAGRLAGSFDPNSKAPQLVHVATDGESYGHHHRHGEMALSYAFQLIEDNKLAQLTNYAEYLASFPPTWEAEIIEDTSWSCAHGIERWRSNCGCNGGRAGWNQKWRTPLRAALDWLRDTITPLTERIGRQFFKDVWSARDAYIDVILALPHERGRAVDRFLAEHAVDELSQPDRTRALKLMEMQRHAQLMYTSCGWFFDDISGIETVQVIAYAARTIQLASDLFGVARKKFEADFLKILAKAQSNVPEWKDGAEIYRRTVEALEVTLEQVAAHFAIASCFSSYSEQTSLFCYTIRRQDYEVATSGRGRLAIGQAHITSNITEESETFFFAALHFGDQNVTAAVKHFEEEDVPAFATFKEKCQAAVTQGNLPEVVRLIDSYFGGSPYSLVSLFTDDQRRILRLILQSTLGEVERSLAAIYEEHASLLHFLSTAALPKPQVLTMAAGFAINASLRRALEGDPIDTARVRSLITLAKNDGLALDQYELSYLVDQRMKHAMVSLEMKPLDSELIEQTIALARTVRELPFRLNLWQAQNIWYDTLTASVEFLKDLGHSTADQWLERFLELGRQLGIAAEQLIVEDMTPATLEETARQAETQISSS